MRSVRAHPKNSLNLCASQFKGDGKSFSRFLKFRPRSFASNTSSAITLFIFNEFLILLFNIKYDQLKRWRLNWQPNNANIRNLIISLLRRGRANTITIAHFNGKIYCLLNLKKWERNYIFFSNTQWFVECEKQGEYMHLKAVICFCAMK